MFNLEQSIAEWRKQMLAAGIKSPVPLEELEIHLREEIGRNIQFGSARNRPLPLQSANLASPANSIRNLTGAEIKTSPLMSKTVLILAGLFGISFGFAMALPVLGTFHRTGTMLHWPPLLIGTTIIFSAASTTLYLIRTNASARGRQMVNIGVILVGLPCTVICASTLFQLHDSEQFWWPPVVAAIAVFFGCCLYFNRPRPSQTRTSK